MTFPDNFEQKTGFDRIRGLLLERCLSPLGRSQVDTIHFSTDPEFLSHELDLVEEMRLLLLFAQGFPAQNYFDLRSATDQLRIKGNWMEVEMLGELRAVLATIHGILAFFLEANPGKYPRLGALAGEVVLDQGILVELDRVLDDQGGIRDNASEKLREVRRQLGRLQTLAEQAVKRTMELARRSGWVPDDTDISVRNGRVVIPVHASAKKKLDGFIHDRSATGQTLFIEPREVFETNNEIRELELEEAEEIRRILIALADMIRPEIPALQEAFAFLGRIDFLRAKGKLALELDAHKPLLRDEAYIEWFDAFHPLLLLSHKAQGKKVVPLKVRVDAAQRILIISGPNAGGKSVALKTIGLLQYMLQCGIAVPMRPTSEAGIFHDILIEIGDQQSLENDLSTYSSHLLNMKFFLGRVGPRSLFLIDEFGTGTEPRFGAALAEAMLEALYDTGGLGVVTTHYANLKSLPGRFEGMQNAAMQFDLKRMEPLFILETGRPGSSFAYEIATRIGLDPRILRAAEEKSGTELIDLDKQLQQLANDQRELEKQRTEARVADAFLAEMIEKYESQRSDLDKRKREILKEAREEAARILDGSNQAIEQAIREIREGQAEKERSRAAREKLEARKQELLHAAGDEVRDDRGPAPRKGEEGVGRKGSRKDGQRKAPDSNPAGPAEGMTIRTGDRVRMEGQQASGEVLSIKGSIAEVAMGQMRLRLPLDKLVPARHSESGATRSGRSSLRHIIDAMNEKMAGFSPQLDLRGQRAEEALKALQDYLDDAILLSIPEVRILHGKGDGILRQVVRDYLGSFREVKAFRDEHIEMGGHGVTIVTLR